MITVIGMGIKEGQLTQEALNEIINCDEVIIRSKKTVAGFGAYSYCVANSIKHTFLDSLYNKAADFSELDKLIEEKIEEKQANGKHIVFLTDGDGIEDVTGEKLVASGAKLISGVSAHGGTGSKTSAAEIIENKPHLNTLENLIIYNVDNAIVASEVKLFLFNFYDGEIPVLVKSEKGETVMPLCEVDRLSEYNYAVTFCISAQASFTKKRFCFNDLMLIMKRLTAKNGCEWDKAQTHESILINLIEEAYEAVDAILSKDLDCMREEVGDVLLQAIFHADIAARSSEFNIEDVISDLGYKLVSRHTHIFGSDRASSADLALGFWETAKAKEKSYESVSHQLSLIPDNFPSLLKAEKVIKKAIKAGMASPTDVAAKVQEALASRDIGRLLFIASALAITDKKDAEVELIKEVNSFMERFSRLEKGGEVQGKAVLEK